MTAALAAFLLSTRRMVTKFGPQRSQPRPTPRPVVAHPPPPARRAPAPRPSPAPAQSSFAQATRAPVQLTAPQPSERLGVNTTPTNLRSASGPIATADWNDPSRIVSRLTQTPASGPTVNSERRCGPASVLGATVMQGREATARLADNLARHGNATAMREVAARLRAGTSSFEDLASLQDEMFAQGNREGSPASLQQAISAAGTRVVQAGQGPEGMSRDRWQFEVDRARATRSEDGAAALTRLLGREVRANNSGQLHLPVAPADARTERSGFSYDELHGLASTTNARVTQTPMDALGERYLHLHRGESIAFTVRGGPASQRDDHFVVLGRDRQGRPFIYNPDPATGDATLTVGSAEGRQPAAFLAALTAYDARRHADTPALAFHPPE